VVEVVEEEVGEELLGGAELAAGSTGWRNKRRRLPPARCSRRKTTTGKSRGPASLAGTAGRLLVQEGHGDEALLLARSDSSVWLVGDGQRRRSSGRRGAERRRGVPLNGGRGKNGVGDDFLGGVRSSGKGGQATWGGDDRWPPAPSALRALSAATRNRGGVRDRATVPGGQTEMGH
jgi:hypothetical protein